MDQTVTYPTGEINELFSRNDVVILEKIYKEDVFYTERELYENDIYVIEQISIYNHYVLLKRLFPQDTANDKICVEKFKLRKL